MRILFWNIGYAPGLNGSLRDYSTKGHHLLRLSERRQRRVIDDIVETISGLSPDLALYAEISLSSGKKSKFNQHDYLVTSLANVVISHAASKYNSPVVGSLPLHKGNANGFVAWHPCEFDTIHLTAGKKTLVYVIKIKKITVVMVHLSLKYSCRKKQLQELAALVNRISGPVILCGDMNIFRGFSELTAFIKETGFHLPKDMPLTFPAFNPKLSLDICLVRDCGPIPLSSPASILSDHAPLVIELPLF